MLLSTAHQVPDIRDARRILCVQPHYDDNDIGAGGALAALSDEGVEVIYLTVTDDLVGIKDPDLPDEIAALQLKTEQKVAGDIIGVKAQYWLGFPDAGDYSYFVMRQEIIRHIRMLRPDFLMTNDPWLPYEAHRDHVKTGKAVAEASYLHAMTRLKTDPDVDQNYEPYEIKGVAFYLTNAHNVTIDITPTKDRKHAALDCYQAQFTPHELDRLHEKLDGEERNSARSLAFMQMPESNLKTKHKNRHLLDVICAIEARYIFLNSFRKLHKFAERLKILTPE